MIRDMKCTERACVPLISVLYKEKWEYYRLKNRYELHKPKSDFGLRKEKQQAGAKPRVSDLISVRMQATQRLRLQSPVLSYSTALIFLTLFQAACPFFYTTSFALRRECLILQAEPLNSEGADWDAILRSLESSFNAPSSPFGAEDQPPLSQKEPEKGDPADVRAKVRLACVVEAGPPFITLFVSL